MAAPAMRTSTGLPTEAVLIVHNMIRKLAKTYQPQYLAAIFESPGPTFRDAEFADYKANRAETPPDLIAQIPYIERLLHALNIPVIQYPGFEADDVLATLAKRARDTAQPALVVSGDTLDFEPTDADKDDYSQNCVGGPANGIPWEEWQAHSQGQNVLFADGHAKWYSGYNTNEMTFRYNSMSGWE